MLFTRIMILFFAYSYTLQAANLAVIHQMTTESDEESSLITLKVKGKEVDKISSFEVHSTFVQLVIPQSTSPEIGKFIDGNSPFFRKVALFKIDGNTIGLRMFPTQDPKTLLNSLTSQVLKGRILIYLDHKTVPPPLTGVPDVEDVVKKVKVRNDISDPAKQLVRAKNDSNKTKTETTDFQNSPMIDATIKDKLIYITVFLAILLVGFVSLLLFRRVASRTGVMPSLDSKITMKTLATYPISPKQKLTLIEVGKQKLLLGVSPENINYLTEINKENNATSLPYQHAQPIHNPTLPQTNQNYKESTKIESIKAKTLNPEKKPNPYTKLNKSDMDSHVKDNRSTKEVVGDQKSIEDVTNLIRRKLKNLPNV